MGRAPCCDKTKVKRGPWSPEEDTALKNYLQKYGTGGNWIALPQKAGLKRCGKSCRLRWLNYLRPDIKHGGFTEEEDNVILTLHANIGSRWSVIASQLPGRTDNDVKNYWNTKLKKKLMAAGAVGPKLPTPPPTTMAPAVNFSNSNSEALNSAPFNQFQSNYYYGNSAYPLKPIASNSMDLIQGYPEVPADHWLYESITEQFSLPGLTEVQENGTPFDGLFTTSMTSSSEQISGLSPSSSSLARSYASWSENVFTGEEMARIFVEMESKSSNQEDLHRQNTRQEEENDRSFMFIG